MFEGDNYHVVRLQVSVDDAKVVAVVKRIDHLQRKIFEKRYLCRPFFFYEPSQGKPFDKAHNKKILPFIGSRKIDDRDNAGMFEF